MQTINSCFSSGVSFKEHTPEMLITGKDSQLLYEKAFLTREPKGENEYNQNTTTWD